MSLSWLTLDSQLLGQDQGLAINYYFVQLQGPRLQATRHQTGDHSSKLVMVTDIYKVTSGHFHLHLRQQNSTFLSRSLTFLAVFVETKTTHFSRGVWPSPAVFVAIKPVF